MNRTERIRLVPSAPLGPEDLDQLHSAGWKLAAIELEREVPPAEAPQAQVAEGPPFGLRVSKEAGALENDPNEVDALLAMMELVIQEGRYSRIADELNRRGFRTRTGGKWSPVSVFQMLPRLIEIGPRLFSTEEWHQRRERIFRAM